MAISQTLDTETLDNLKLDPDNPRLGKLTNGRDTNQDELLLLMQDFTLDELMVSFIEGGGFWTQEALIVVEEILYGKNNLVVVEGNRRLAALKYLQDWRKNGQPANSKWERMIDISEISESLFLKIPYLKADSRQDVESYLGFRHVTGIKQWEPREKARFISKMIDDHKLSFREVARKIGSRADVIRQHYVANNLLNQAENILGNVEIDIEDRFSVFYLSLRTPGVQKYLNINLATQPEFVTQVVDKDHHTKLSNLVKWIFGETDSSANPLFSDSRSVDQFGKILLSAKAVEYLEKDNEPSYQVALSLSGVNEAELTRTLTVIYDTLRGVQSFIVQFKTNLKVKRLLRNIYDIVKEFQSKEGH